MSNSNVNDKNAAVLF